MKTFVYKCYDENRIKSSGTIIAKNKKDATRILENKYLKVISLKEKRTFIKLEKKSFQKLQNFVHFRIGMGITYRKRTFRHRNIGYFGDEPERKRNQSHQKNKKLDNKRLFNK